MERVCACSLNQLWFVPISLVRGMILASLSVEGVYGFGFAAPLDGAAGGRTAQADIDVGLRDYMLRIYNYMASGLGADRHRRLCRSRIFRLLRSRSRATPLIWLVMLAPLGFVLLLSFGIQRMRRARRSSLFWVFAGGHGPVAGARSSWSSPGRASRACSSSPPARSRR